MRLTLTQWILAGAAVVVLILLVLMWFQSRTIKGLRADNATLAASVATFQSANETNLGTIADLKAANTGWADKCRADPAATVRALEEMAAERDRLQRDLAEASRQREVIYVRDPEARRWRDAPLPRSLSDQLWPQEGRGEN